MSFPFTRFPDVFAKSLILEDAELVRLEELAHVTVSSKEQQEMGKLARFGALPSPPDATGRGCSLRWDSNVVMVSGVEGDIDGGQISLQEVVDRLNAAGIIAFVHTTASHTPQAPRLRVWCPFSKELPPRDRARMVNRLNGLLGGVLARESWALSQAFFIGRVDGVPFESAITDGDAHINELDELDPGLPFQPAPGQGQGPQPKKGKQPAPDYAALPEDELRDLILAGAHFFGPAKELANRFALQGGITAADAEMLLVDLFDKVDQQNRTRKWSNVRGRLPKIVADAYARALKKKGTYFRALVTRFEEADPWRSAIRFNRFTQQLEVSDPFPPSIGQTIGDYRPLRDPVDILEAMMCVQENGFPNAGKETVTSAIVLVGEHNAYHPVQRWLRDLDEWDGEERINKLFVAYFPGELPPESDPPARDEITRYFEKVGECFMVGAVARVMRGGCKLDCLPCLVGLQGFDKSRGVQALCPVPEWFSDDLSTDITSRDAKESLTGKLIIELSEFPHVRRDIDRVKAFFSRQSDRYRRAYGRLNTDHPRQCVFIATANALEFIDMTGNRRVWPIPLAGRVDVAAIGRDKEQLWAEALHWFDQGFEWWLAPELEAIAGLVQDSFIELDEWDGLILKFLDRAYPEKADGTRDRFTRREVVQGMGFSYADPGDPHFPKAGDEKRVERRLRRLGFCADPHRPRTGSGRRERYWVTAKGAT